MIDKGDFLVTPFKVAVDDREQIPYTFAGMISDANAGSRDVVVKQEVVHLPTGDYSIIGMEDEITVERKSLGDLFGTLGGERDRFEKQFERMSDFKFACVVVEAQWEDVLERPPESSQLKPKTVWRTVLSWQQRFNNVHWNFMPGRRAAEVWTFRTLERYWRNKQHNL